MSSNIVKLPKRRIFTTPMPLRTDAYTSGSPIFQSSDAIFNSVYYITHRKPLNGHDHRIVSVGLSNIIEDLFYDPITHEDIDESVASLAKFQVSTNGFRPYPFPEALWRRVVDEFNGRPPIKIESVREGTVVYPNEPVVQVRTMVAGFGTFNYKHIELDLDKSIVLVVNNSTIHSDRDIKDLALHLGSRNFRTFRTYKLGIINGTPIRALFDLSDTLCGTRLALNTLTELKSKSLELYGK